MTPFDQFWQAYPHRVAKGQARRTFAKLEAEGILPEIGEVVAGVQRSIEAGVFDRPKYSPHPSTWLNGERWEDEYQAEPASLLDEVSGMPTHEWWIARREGRLAQ